MSTEESIKRVYGWVPDLPSTNNNFLLTAHSTVIRKFPPKMSLTNLPPVYDQGQLGSCTANALGGAFEYEQIKQGLADFMPSRLFIYYNERKLEDNIPYDTGASICDGIKTLTKDGVCPEQLCPYDIEEFATCPSENAYKVALDHQISSSMRVQPNINAFKTIINMKLPIVFGFTVYSSFESQEVAKSGMMPLPINSEKVLGGHAVICVGYDDTLKSADKTTVGYLKIRNSWGPNWGQQGYFWMPYAFVDKMKLVSDSWAIMKNEEPLKLNKMMSKPEHENILNKLKNFVKKIPSMQIVVKTDEGN